MYAKVTRRYVTLIEMLIVMFLIAMIIGVVALNYQGALEEGKAFKSKAGKDKIENILTLAVSQDPNLEQGIETGWKEIIRKSPLITNPEDLIKDGWGDEYQVTVESGKVKVTSTKYDEYIKK